MEQKKIILASQSPRRKQLLEMAEIDFDVIAADTDESFPPEMPVTEVPVYIAQQKAKAVDALYPGRKIIAADTIVVLGNDIIGKPLDREDAVEILSRLSGQTHRVITGVVIRHEQIEHSFADETLVSFNSLSPAQIAHYVDHYKPYDKAGAYAIQEWIGAVAIRRIEGCFYNVMGLPVSRVIPFL